MGDRLQRVALHRVAGHGQGEGDQRRGLRIVRIGSRRDTARATSGSSKGRITALSPTVATSAADSRPVESARAARAAPMMQAAAGRRATASEGDGQRKDRQERQPALRDPRHADAVTLVASQDVQLRLVVADDEADMARPYALDPALGYSHGADLRLLDLGTEPQRVPRAGRFVSNTSFGSVGRPPPEEGTAPRDLGGFEAERLIELLGIPALVQAEIAKRLGDPGQRDGRNRRNPKSGDSLRPDCAGMEDVQLLDFLEHLHRFDNETAESAVGAQKSPR